MPIDSVGRDRREWQRQKILMSIKSFAVKSIFVEPLNCCVNLVHKPSSLQRCFATNRLRVESRKTILRALFP